MDKATKVAVEKYTHGTFDGELGDSLRAACAVGYMQAQKDLALTWIDIRNILSIAREVEDENDDCPLLKSELCDEILKRFNEQRKK